MNLCPHCGYNLTQDVPIATTDIQYEPRSTGVTWHGKFVHLRPMAHIILGTLLKAGGRVVSEEVLAERAGYDGDRPNELVKVEIHRLRKCLPGVPIRNRTKEGYYWEQSS